MVGWLIWGQALKQLIVEGKKEKSGRFFKKIRKIFSKKWNSRRLLRIVSGEKNCREELEVRRELCGVRNAH